MEQGREGKSESFLGSVQDYSWGVSHGKGMNV